MFGKLKGYSVNKNVITIDYDKIKATISIINEGVINFFIPVYRKERNSKAVEEINYTNVDFSIEEEESSIILKTKKLILEIKDNFIVNIYDKDRNILCRDYDGKREPFVRHGNNLFLAEEEGHNLNGHQDYKIFVPKIMEDNMYFYGLGERTGSLNKKGYHYKNWNTDDPSPHGETFEQLYKSIPFLISLKDNNAFGIFFDNHFETHFDMGKENSKYYYFSAVDGNIDYYFIYGPEVKDVVYEYTNLTVKTPLPQMWTLGYQQCRWSYTPKERVLEIAKAFREKGIPCDTLYLDIDYMDDFRVFTWDNKTFENPNVFIDELNKLGFKVVTIIDPGVKIDKDYSIYSQGIKNDYFAKDKDGIVYKNRVWPGDSVYPDFMNSRTRKWWSDNQKIMIDTGVSGIWNDMNEPASFNGPLPNDVTFNEDGLEVTHKEVHNVYGHMMCKATYEGIKEATNKRPFVITRACYSGTQKYSTIWTGDNQSTWEHLRMSIPMLMNLGLSGMVFCGTDVGGFGHDCTGELLSRWVQVGTFTPLFRNHSAMGTREQEPWAFNKETEEINKKYINLRYKLIPYLYNLMWKSESTGAPIIRPLLFEYQYDNNTYEINDQFLCGDSILVSPVLEQGMRQKLVYLPKGNNWIDYWTGENYNGGQYIIKKSPIDICPIFIKESSIIPMGVNQNYIGEVNNDELTLNIYLGEEGKDFSYTHYNDDGESFEYKEGVYNQYDIKVSNKDTINIYFTVSKNNYINKYSKVKFILNNLKEEKSIFINGKKVVLNNNMIEFNI